MSANTTLGNVEGTNHDTMLSLRKIARIAGVLYLLIFAGGIFAQFVVREGLIVSGDAAATAENIMESEGLFRAGIAGDLVMIISDIAIALLFYVLLRPVSKMLAQIAALFRLAQAVTLGINLLNMFFALLLLGGADYLDSLGADQSNALALMFLDAHAIGYRIALVFFGISILILGYLMIKADYFPTILGIGMIVASFGYLTDSFANFLLTNYSDYEELFGTVVTMPAVIAELALTVWLLWKGVSIRQRNDRSLAATQTEVIGA